MKMKMVVDDTKSLGVSAPGGKPPLSLSIGILIIIGLILFASKRRK